MRGMPCEDATADFQISWDLCKKVSHRSPFIGSIHAKSSVQVIPWTVLSVLSVLSPSILLNGAKLNIVPIFNQDRAEIIKSRAGQG
jgi:hypothetical protein